MAGGVCGFGLVSGVLYLALLFLEFRWDLEMSTNI